MSRLPMLQTASITCRDEFNNAVAMILARLARARLGSLLETPA